VSARPESDGGLGYLEQKLGLYIQGTSQTRRNAALDLLTGRVTDERPVSPEVAKPSGPVKSPPLPVPPTRTHPSPTYRPARVVHASIDARPRFRIEHATRPPAARWPFKRALVLTGVSASVVLLAGFGVRTWAERVVIDVPMEVVSPVMVETTIATLEPRMSAVPTAVTAPVPAKVLTVLVDERFTSNALGWPNNPQATAWLAGGAYRLAARQASHFVAIGIPSTEALGDTVVSGWFHKVGGPSGGGYGLIVRDQHPQLRDGQNQLGDYYVFEVGDRGEVGVWLRDGDRWIDLLTWTPSAAVKPGTASNELTVTAAGDRLSFVVNGIPVASQTDTTLRTGATGVFVGGDGNEVSLDRIVVSSTR
jgi:hypothetical protein